MKRKLYITLKELPLHRGYSRVLGIMGAKLL